MTTDEVKDENIIFSPFSIQLCIALAHLGASGETANEIGHVIGYSSNFSHAKISTLLDYLNKQDVLQIANKVYAKKGLHLNTKYETSLQNSLKSSVESIDFDQRSPAAKTISGWIEAQTNHKIKDMVKPDMINDGTKLMLVNAVYFKANWDTEFNNARPGDFTNHDLSISEVPMMHKQMWLPMTHLDTLASHVVKIPYANTNIAMFLVIPDTTSGLSYIEQNLDQLNFMKISTQMESTFMTFEMPKFEFKTGADLVEPLKRMGMPTAFTNEADFSNMLSPKEDMYITDVIHKAYIKVDEKGTEAGAATGNKLRISNIGRKISNFIH